MKYFFSSLFILGLLGSNLHAAPKVGQQAPDFKLHDETGIERTLQEFRGKKVVLYFFPKADSTFSPYCTKQACNFNKDFIKFTQHNVVVLGISYDSVKDLKKFKDRNHLCFTLLSDNKKRTAKKYGASCWWFPFFPNRMTYIIDENGKIISIMKNVDAAANSTQVLRALGIE